MILAFGLVFAAAPPSAAQSSPTEAGAGATPAPDAAAAAGATMRTGRGGGPASTADHSRFKELAGPFASPAEVNQACLTCHNTGAEQLHGSIHYTWTWPTGKAGDGDAAKDKDQLLGMLHVANGFLLSVPSNIGACSSCHISGTRFDDAAMLDPSSEPKAPVDCLTCHEPTGKWALANFHEGGAACSMCHDQRLPGAVPDIKDLAAAARSIGPTTRASCGSCHFNADGGNGVKHGDLNADLAAPAATLDVHMAPRPDGRAFTCSTCHTTRDHVTAGSRYAGGPGEAPRRPALAGAAASCQSCHTDGPHQRVAGGARLDRHVDRIACQTCHIPEIARGETGTRVLWDWSTVGTLGRDARSMITKDRNGDIVYSSEKGSLMSAGSVKPTLVWSDGQLRTHRPGDPLPGPVAAVEAPAGAGVAGGDSAALETAFAGSPWISSYTGDAEDPASRIVPVKVMHSVVPVDADGGALAAVRFAGRSGEALWNRFDWKAAAGAGMKAAGLPFSGEVAFAKVRQMIPVNHMVAPAEQALGCQSCHVASGGLLADVPGGLVPRRGGMGLIEWVGLAILAATLAGVLLHGFARIGFSFFYRGPRHG
ncbi:multiheme c-type cytochrome [Hoeflea olei]|uniref:multiheme c-type cytochrome n=1 Tax=Hoeflea olei TaxID=1480615 RepID=UPI0014955645|nr:multiheme c-type cytochrome [Hoeflea olei]